MRKLILAPAVAAALAAATPATAQAPVLTLTIGKPGRGPQGTVTTVRYGELVRVSGSISEGGANRSVELIVSPYRGEPRRVMLQTDSLGFFRYAHRPTIRTGYAARSGTLASRQAPYAHVRPKVGLRVINARSGRFRVTMRAQPEHVSRVVWFQRRTARAHWANVKKIHIRQRNLSARFTARLPRGFQRVRIFVPQTPGYLRGTSRFVRVRGFGR
ncbi:MAG TPA: hypothetical protein VFA34_03525 [Actinomycetota bacterium]|jgi:hypothetical protein|nr:hypothetical protein [Actinomycetota bacterium]